MPSSTAMGVFRGKVPSHLIRIHPDNATSKSWVILLEAGTIVGPSPESAALSRRSPGLRDLGAAHFQSPRPRRALAPSARRRPGLRSRPGFIQYDSSGSGLLVQVARLGAVYIAIATTIHCSQAS